MAHRTSSPVLPQPLLVLSALAAVLAVLHAIFGIIDNITLILLGAAAAPWLLLYVRKWDGPFGEMEFRLETAEKELSAIKRSVPLPGAKPPPEVEFEPSTGEDAQPGIPFAPPASMAMPADVAYAHEELPRPQGAAPAEVAPAGPKAAAETGGPARGQEFAPVAKPDPDDPNKGRFGGLASVNGRELTATVEPAINRRSRACEVELMVCSTDPHNPLQGKVTFHLHPTFGRWRKYSVKVEEGVARTDFTSWGVFTVGVEADEGRTRLELDLSRVPGGTPAFYRN